MGRREPALILFALGSLLLCPDCGSGRLPSATLRRIRQAHERFLVVDAHIDAALLLRGRGGRALFRRMKAGGIDAAFIMVPAGEGDRKAGDARSALGPSGATIERIRKLIERSSGKAALALAPPDAYRLEKEGRIAVFLGLGGGEALGDDISRVRAYHAQGVRVLSLCGDADNLICDAAGDRTHPEDRGLSDFGREVVAECNRLGLMIDVGGCSERSFFDVLAASRSPVIMTRAAARALRDRPDNASDEMIRALAEKGGAVLVGFVPERLKRTAPAAGRAVSVADVADHISHVRGLAGVEACGIASGFGAGGGLPGLRDPGHLLRLTIELLRRGYDGHETEAVWGGNLMTVFERAAAGAGER